MTITELRQRLQELEARGDGDAIVLMNDREVVERAVVGMTAPAGRYCVLQGLGERLYANGARSITRPISNGMAQFSCTIPNAIDD